MNRRKAIWILGMVVGCSSLIRSDTKKESHNVFASTKQAVSHAKNHLPEFCVPYGARSNLWPRLVHLGAVQNRYCQQHKRLEKRFVKKWSVPEYAEATKAVSGIYPSYYEMKSGQSQVIGFAAVNGRILPHVPLSVFRKDRCLVVTRRTYSITGPNLWVIHPRSLWILAKQFNKKQIKPNWSIDKRFVLQLGISLKRYDIFTGHYNACVQPERWCRRGGLIMTPNSLEPFYWDSYRANWEIIKSAANGRLVLSGDGGSTIARSGIAPAPLGLFFYRKRYSRVSM